MGNDIGTSQDFIPGQLNVSDVELDNIIGGSYIKTQFYTAKPSAGASPSKSNFQVLLLDNTVPASPAFKLSTLAEAFFDSNEFMVSRTLKASPVAADKVLLGDSAAGFVPKSSTVKSILFGGADFTGGAALWNSAGVFDHTTDQCTVTANNTLQTGIPFRFTTTGTLPAGLAINTTYYAILISSTVIKVAVTFGDATAGTAFTISDNGTGTHTLTLWVEATEVAGDDLLTFLDSSSQTIYAVRLNTLLTKLPARAVALDTTDTLPVTNTEGTRTEKATLAQLTSLVQSSVNPPGLVSPFAGSAVPTGWLPCDGAAVNRTTYAALFAAVSTTWGAGDGSTTFNVPDFRGRTLAGDGTGVWSSTFTADNVTNEFTVTSNSLLYTGTPVTVSNSGGALPVNLFAATTYYVIRLSATVIKLATSVANAIAGTAIDINSDGSGTNTVLATLTARTAGQITGEESHALTVSEIPAHTHAIGAASTVGGGGSSALLVVGSLIATTSTGGSAEHNNMQPTAFVKWIIKT